eukprot:scaffold3125_cov174-Amphora_coffeaeformis.AAC.1
MIPSPVPLYHLLCYMAPIAAATSFRTLCIPADCPTITLFPFSIAFTQFTPSALFSSTPSTSSTSPPPSTPFHASPPVHCPPSPLLLCPEEPPLSTTLVRPFSVATAHFSGTSLASPADVVDIAAVASFPSAPSLLLPHCLCTLLPFAAPSPVCHLPFLFLVAQLCSSRPFSASPVAVASTSRRRRTAAAVLPLLPYLPPSSSPSPHPPNTPLPRPTQPAIF